MTLRGSARRSCAFCESVRSHGGGGVAGATANCPSMPCGSRCLM